MQAFFAFTNEPVFEFDPLAAAQGVGPFGPQPSALETFVLDLADIQILGYVKGKPFKWELLDAAQYEIKTRARLKGQFTTKPDIALTGELVSALDMWGITFDQYVLSTKELLVRWTFALSRWLYVREAGIYEIPTDGTAIFSAGPNAGLSAMPDVDLVSRLAIPPYLKVIVDSELTPSKFEGLFFGQQLTVDFTSAFAYDV